MTIPYRTRRALRSLGIVGVVMLLLLLVLWLVWMLWLDRFVVYTRDGVRLDFSRSAEQITGSPAQPPDTDQNVSIYYNEGENALNISTELTQVVGYYIDMDALANDMEKVLTTVKKLPAQTAVMIDMKDNKGRFSYASSMGVQHSKIDATSMEELLKYLTGSDLYVIARIPAFQEFYYFDGDKNLDNGLVSTKGAYLHRDDEGCYWLDPSKEGTMTYLIQILSELKTKGFDEVVLSDFSVPPKESVRFNKDRTEALSTAAKSLLAASGTDRFAVSFVMETLGAFTLPEGRSRLYLAGTSAVEAKTLAEQSGLEDTAVDLVFITENNDTRFDVYGVLRPIGVAQVG